MGEEDSRGHPCKERSGFKGRENKRVEKATPRQGLRMIMKRGQQENNLKVC